MESMLEPTRYKEPTSVGRKWNGRCCTKEENVDFIIDYNYYLVGQWAPKLSEAGSGNNSSSFSIWSFCG